MVLFGTLPQLFDITVSCAYMAAALQPWIALIVFVLLITYIPLRYSPTHLKSQDCGLHRICLSHDQQLICGAHMQLGGRNKSELGCRPEHTICLFTLQATFLQRPYSTRS